MASVKDTEYDGTFNIEATWTRSREMYHEELAPSKLSITANICADWTTYDKLNDWFTQHKPILINSGLAINKPMVLPDGITVELTIPED